MTSEQSFHIYHYNINSEQRFFLGQSHRSLFDLIALSGNIVSHTPAGVASFIATAAKPYYIDPQTHAFQHDTINLKRDVSDKESDEEPVYDWKPSVLRMAKERLGPPFDAVIDSDRPLSPRDFQDDRGQLDKERVTMVVENVISFQDKVLSDSLDDDDKEFMDEGAGRFCPEFLLAPYFYLSSHCARDWLEINVRCYEITREVEPGRRVLMPLVVSKQFMVRDRKLLAEVLEQVKPDGILLWIDDFVEEELTGEQVRDYVDLLSTLHRSTGIVLNSHGGYLSVLLTHRSLGRLLSGVGHSINYGENRSVVPVGGGLPMARFYFPCIHSRLRYSDALEVARGKQWLLNKDAYRNVCDCEQCGELLERHNSVDKAFYVYGKSKPITFQRRSRSGGRQLVRLDYPTAEAKQAAARHYLLSKHREFSDVRERDYDELVDKLKTVYDDLLPDVDDRLYFHLFHWHQGLRSRVT